MSPKAIVMLAFTIGSYAGSYIPVLFGASSFSLWTIIWGTVGGGIGIYLGYKISQNIS